MFFKFCIHVLASFCGALAWKAFFISGGKNHNFPLKVALSKFETDKYLNYQHLEDNLKVVRNR